METRKIIFRLNDQMKRDLKVALARHNIGLQHVAEAMVELIIDKEGLDKNTRDVINNKLIARAVELSIEGKRR